MILWPFPSPLFSPFVQESQSRCQTDTRELLSKWKVLGVTSQRRQNLWLGAGLWKSTQVFQPLCTSELSPGLAHGHCRARCSPRAAGRNQGSSLARLPQGGPWEGPSRSTKQENVGQAWCVSLSGIDLPNSFKYFPFFFNLMFPIIHLSQKVINRGRNENLSHIL